jgi:hypothetical protein
VTEGRPSITGYSVKSHRSPHYGIKCAGARCGKPMRVGDTCIIFDAGPGVYVRRETGFHRRCLLDFLLATPMEKAHVESEVERIRIDGSAVLELLGAD